MEEKGDGPDAAPAPDAADNPNNCDELGVIANGKHNQGQACMNCHTGSPGPLFTVAGTLYNDVAGTAPVAGATVHLVDGNGNDIPLVTADNGNFWTTAAVTFPVTVSASLCPDSVQMVTPVNDTGGNCNAAGCHADGFRVHLP